VQKDRHVTDKTVILWLSESAPQKYQMEKWQIVYYFKHGG